MAMTISEWERRERREAPRARLQLRLAIVYPQREGRPYRPIHHGITHDVCMSGLSTIVDDNIFHEGEVTVLLALPPVHGWAAQRVITATAQMTYGIRSSKLNAYKVGMVFSEFKGDGKRLLRAALQQLQEDAGAQHRASRSNGNRPVDSRPMGWW